MIHFRKKIFLTFILLSVCSSFSLANGIVSELPAAFFANYNVSADGSLYAVAQSTDTNLAIPYVFDRSSDGEALNWAVTSYPCAQNKSFNCVGIYKNENSKILGNKMSPFPSILNESGFTLLKMNPLNGEQNTVIKCSSQFIEKPHQRDTANLANCVEYTKDSCKKWTDYINKNAAEFKKIVTKAEECTDVLSSVDKMNIQLRNTFQSDIKKSEKDITSSFDKASNPDRTFFSRSTKTEYSQDKLSPHISTFKDLFDRTSDCAQYESFFVKKYAGTASARHISSKLGLKAPGGEVKLPGSQVQ